MLTKPRHGWTYVEIEDLKIRASYLTDVPNDCLDSFIFALENKLPVAIYFDAEDLDYYLFVSHLDSFIIMEKDDLQIFKLKSNIIDLGKELVNDIEEYIDEWANWLCYRDYTKKEILQNKNILKQKVNRLKQLLKE